MATWSSTLNAMESGAELAGEINNAKLDLHHSLCNGPVLIEAMVCRVVSAFMTPIEILMRWRKYKEKQHALQQVISTIQHIGIALMKAQQEQIAGHGAEASLKTKGEKSGRDQKGQEQTKMKKKNQSIKFHMKKFQRKTDRTHLMFFKR